MRRRLNCSVRLDWDTEVAPVVTIYMSRMKKAGYDETYRRQVLDKALNLYHKLRKEDEDGKKIKTAG